MGKSAEFLVAKHQGDRSTKSKSWCYLCRINGSEALILSRDRYGVYTYKWDKLSKLKDFKVITEESSPFNGASIKPESASLLLCKLGMSWERLYGKWDVVLNECLPVLFPSVE
jgi:hypothetical protein